MAFAPEHLLDRLAALPPVERYLIGFSGGLDSTVLLHALIQLQGRAQFSIEAIHIHHGLQRQADRWASHCRSVCERLTVPFRLIHIDASAAKGESPEAAARAARYRALRSLVKLGVCLLTAHQQDDQAETLLLQLLRGSGPAGLAAMPDVAPFGEGWLARPLLCFTRSELAEYAVLHKLEWMDDASNLNTEIDRNFLRHEVLPALRARWPGSAQTLSRAAGLQAEVVALLGDLARQDSITVGGSRPRTLSVAKLRPLSAARQRNVLRCWLTERKLPIPAQRQLEHVLTDCVGGRWDSMPVVSWPGAEVRRYRDDLYAIAPLSEHDPAMVLRWDARGPLLIPHLGVTLEPSMLESREAAAAVNNAEITVRFRRGGERCRPCGHRHHHELKKLFQDAGVPPWERDRIPLIYSGERLIAVTGHWACE